MYFNSMTYIFVFLPIVLIVYFTLNKYKLVVLSKIWLLLVSVYFYTTFNIFYTPVFLLYILINYCFYKCIKLYENEKIKAKKVLIFSVMSNIVILCVFKYFNFFINTINIVFKNNIPCIQIIVPLALSLQTLQQICFLTDCYNNKKIKYSFLDYFLFSIYFPQMLIGPIVKHNETIPQFNNLRKKLFNHKNFITGLSIFLIGFYKKSFFAENLSLIRVNNIALISSMSTLEAWLFCIIEYFRVYLDLSSYTDMAIGTALMMNIELPVNFNSPLQAHNIKEFWQRWQITFARFMKNYVFIPLKSIKSKQWSVNPCFAITATCIIGGLWNGNSMCAAIWGLFHAIAFIVHELWKKLNIKMFGFISIIITFLFMASTGIFLSFRSNLEIYELIKHMFCWYNFDKLYYAANNIHFCSNLNERIFGVYPIAVCIVGLILTFLKISIEGKDLSKFVRPNLFWAFVLALAVIELIFFYSPPTGFLYYNE